MAKKKRLINLKLDKVKKKKESSRKVPGRNKLQKFIIKYRLDNDLTLEQMGKKIGYGKSYLSRIESGERKPSGIKFAHALKKLGLNNNKIIDLLT